NKIYLASFERQGKKSYARVGAMRVVMDEYDAARIVRWSERRGNKIEGGDLIPVRVAKVEVKHGSGKKAYAETVEQAQRAQRPEVQAALVAIDPSTGHLTAMVGGYDYDLSQFNRATQARRQAGSSIKPYIYAAAIDHGYTELSIVQDAPIAVRTASGVWAPHNYKSEYLGAITLRTALAKSINT